MKTMKYTEDQKTLIGGVLSVQVLGRHLPDPLRKLLAEVYEDLQSDRLNARDLRIIESALELVTPQRCAACSMDEYRDLIGALMATRRMMSRKAG